MLIPNWSWYFHHSKQFIYIVFPLCHLMYWLGRHFYLVMAEAGECFPFYKFLLWPSHWWKLMRRPLSIKTTSSGYGLKPFIWSSSLFHFPNGISAFFMEKHICPLSKAGRSNGKTFQHEVENKKMSECPQMFPTLSALIIFYQNVFANFSGFIVLDTDGI